MLPVITRSGERLSTSSPKSPALSFRSQLTTQHLLSPRPSIAPVYSVCAAPSFTLISFPSHISPGNQKERGGSVKKELANMIREERNDTRRRLLHTLGKNDNSRHKHNYLAGKWRPGEAKNRERRERKTNFVNSLLVEKSIKAISTWDKGKVLKDGEEKGRLSEQDCDAGSGKG